MELNDEPRPDTDEGQITTDGAATATVAVKNLSNLAPDTGKPLDMKAKIRFGIGFVLFGLLWMTAGTAGSAVLLPQRFSELNIGVPEVILGTMNSVGCVFALVSNIVFGAFSDVTRSRFGKRTPWVIVGGFIAGGGYAITATSTTLFGIVAGWSIVQIGVNCMIAPAIAVLSDRIPENVRGTFSAFYGGADLVGSSLGTFVGAKFISNMGTGFTLGVALFIFAGVAAVLAWPRELSSKSTGNAEKLHFSEIAKAFIPPTKNCRDFYLALCGRLMFILGWQMIGGYQLYILQKYCHMSKTVSASVLSQMAALAMVVQIIMSLVSGPLSDKLHRRKILVFIGSAIIAVGLAIPWFFPTKEGMLAYALVGNFGYGMYKAVDQALNVDVLPSGDEAGKDLGILNLANTLGQVIAPVIVSAIIVATNSYAILFPIAIAGVMIGAIIIMFIKKVK
ncbi:MFS transporter [Bifidobacterium sp. ESL0800]|uniref:MFS transporter n=1 Tax=Bifidobacterium sp. ESL0800 TaxID=2983236 RepID=UPI0023F6348D|nr:MFS transporter [Bifidobacterium sp. ESL0800]WEV75312.1 MFS transporter [Bifidobacterium sp. ESL0800]